MWYLYCNSRASSVNYTQGFIGHYDIGGHKFPLKKTKFGWKAHTTKEFAFAKGFASQREAEDFVNKYKLTAILFERRNLT